jgi:hypothetical protein
MVERAGFELAGDFVVSDLNRSNRRCQEGHRKRLVDVTWKPLAKRFVSFAIPTPAM